MEFTIPEDAPTWFMIVLFLVVTFKGTLIKILPSAVQAYFKRMALRQAEDAELEEVALNAEIQTKATKHLREVRKHETLENIISSMQDFQQNAVMNGIQGISTDIDELTKETMTMKRATIRNGDIIAALLANMKENNGNVFLKVMDELSDIFEGINREDYK